MGDFVVVVAVSDVMVVAGIDAVAVVEPLTRPEGEDGDETLCEPAIAEIHAVATIVTRTMTAANAFTPKGSGTSFAIGD